MSHYMEFVLCDPSLITTVGIEGTAVLVVGALFEADFIRDVMPSTPQREAFDNSLSILGHSVTARRLMAQRATEPGVLHFYYCARCGGRLLQQHCEGCNAQYVGMSHYWVSSDRPLIPWKVVAYAVQHGYQFELQPQ